MDHKTLSALIGLAGAIGNNGKTENTDQVVRGALISEDHTDWVSRIHQEKHRIAPDCATCPNPCGNTSDYPLEGFDGWSEEQRLLKEQILRELQRIAAGTELPDVVYKGISYMGYDLEEKEYVQLLEEMKKW